MYVDWYTDNDKFEMFVWIYFRTSAGPRLISMRVSESNQFHVCGFPISWHLVRFRRLLPPQNRRKPKSLIAFAFRLLSPPISAIPSFHFHVICTAKCTPLIWLKTEQSQTKLKHFFICILNRWGIYAFGQLCGRTGSHVECECLYARCAAD